MYINDIINEFNRRVEECRSLYIRIWSAILFVVVIAFLISYIFIGFNQIIAFIALGVVLLIIVAILITRGYVSEKPTYNYLIPAIISDIYNETEYTPYPKDIKHINKEGGLFPRQCAVTSKGAIQYTDTQILLNKRIFYTDGKTTYQYLYGVYIVIESINNCLMQIRSKQKPQLKGIKFKKIDTDGDLRVYVTEDNDSDCYMKYLNLVDSLRNELNAKSVYMGVYNNQIHFAYETKDDIKKVEMLNDDSYNALKKQIANLIDIVNKIKSIN